MYISCFRRNTSSIYNRVLDASPFILRVAILSMSALKFWRLTGLGQVLILSSRLCSSFCTVSFRGTALRSSTLSLFMSVWGRLLGAQSSSRHTTRRVHFLPPPPAVFLVHAFVSFLTFRLRQRSAIFILFFFYETPFRHAGYPSLRSQFIASVALNTATGGRCVASLLPSPTRGAICPHFSGLSDTPCVIVCPYSELDYRCSACVPMACPACSPLRVSSSPSSLSGR